MPGENTNWTEIRAELEARHIELTDRLGRVEEEHWSSALCQGHIARPVGPLSVCWRVVAGATTR